MRIVRVRFAPSARRYGARVRLRVRILVSVTVLAVGAACVASASGSSSLRYGIQDDAWLEFGAGTIESRVATLERLGVDIVRVTLHWNAIEPSRGQFDWERSDALLSAIRSGGLTPLVTLWGTPSWANGGRSAAWAPTSPKTFAAFAGAAAARYPWIRHWLIWNEPNQSRWLRPTSASIYVTRLLNPAYAAIRSAIPAAKIGGGSTAPRAGRGGVSPIEFLRTMARAGARLDAFAHHPYPLSTVETPWSGGCASCQTLSISKLPALLSETAKAFGSDVRIWLTETGYQTNPPDRTLGVTPLRAATYAASTLERATALPRIDVLVHYLYRDEPDVARFQSGLVSIRDAVKPARRAISIPLAQVSREGLTTRVWAQVRTRSGVSSVVLQRRDDAGWRAVTRARTSTRGWVKLTLRAVIGTRLRIFVPASGETSNVLDVR